MEHLCGDERLTLAGMKYGNRKEFQANSLPSLLSPSLQVKGLATTAQRAFIAGPTPAPRGRQAPRPLRPSALFLWLSSLHVRISCYQFFWANFRHLTTQKPKQKRLELFVFFLKCRLNKRKKRRRFIGGKTLPNKNQKGLEFFFVFLVQIQPKKRRRKEDILGGKTRKKKNQKKGWNFLCFLVQIQKN